MGLKNKNSDVPRITGSRNQDSIHSVMCFSFKYLTKKKDYNFSYFNTEKERIEAKAVLYDRIEEISLNTWQYWNDLRDKYTGLETIEARQLKFNPKDYDLKKDDKVYVFRFCKQKYRMIGFKLNQLPVFFVIGFDFNHSAYDHGS